MLKNTGISKRVTQTGVGLIEVMVALFILGVGLLGILNMQTQSLVFNQQAYYLSQANALLWDISDRMKANSSVPESYLMDFNSTVSTATDCESQECSATQLASWDTNQWLGAVRNLLPQGDAEIVRNGSFFEINIEFDLEQTPGVDPMTVSATLGL